MRTMLKRIMRKAEEPEELFSELMVEGYGGEVKWVVGLSVDEELIEWWQWRDLRRQLVLRQNGNLAPSIHPSIHLSTNAIYDLSIDHTNSGVNVLSIFIH